MMPRTWVATVASEMNRSPPICLLLRPSAINCATSACRFGSSPGTTGSGAPSSSGVDSPRARRTAMSRLMCLPDSNSDSNFAVPSAPIADSLASASSGTAGPMMSAPAPVATASAAPSSRAATRNCPELAACQPKPASLQYWPSRLSICRATCKASTNRDFAVSRSPPNTPTMPRLPSMAST